jgi:molecular chaperone IbpA
MTKITSFDLTPFYRNSVGMDSLFDRIIDRIDHSSINNYPPYNIVKVADNSYEIQVAAAGFLQGDIEINFHDGQLEIKGDRKDDRFTEDQYLHRGISFRKFVRTFDLAEYVEVKSATVKDGILCVHLERIVPDSMKPKKIEIEYLS